MYENSLPALPKNKKVDELIIHPNLGFLEFFLLEF